MIKKILATVIILNAILINLITNYLYPKVSYSNEIDKKVIDIKNTNDLINTYSNLIISIVPANE
jgi:hypothetical protein